MVHDSFAEFMVAIVLSGHQANPEHIRLNGEPTGGDQNAAGYFRHHGRTWKVDADTRYAPLLAAYDHLQQTGEDPFREDHTPKRDSLVLIDSLQAKLEQLDEKYRRHKYHYIYARREEH